MSMLICILFLVAYYFRGITDMYTFKVILSTFGGMFILSTGYYIYELNRDKQKKSKQDVSEQ
ncbi:MAG: hypothetical protein QG630_286 [Patescibacteria group bacterium]|nr:hypothetical protein [Patescibacteria group bacterium]